MNALADALVYAVTYISLRTEAEGHDDDDVRALESIATMLSSASNAEKEALAMAADRAAASEKIFLARPEFVQTYSNWMESIFGDRWSGSDQLD